MIDITPRIKDFIKNNEAEEGVVSVFVKGSTGAVTTVEYEPNLERDFEEAMERFAPSDRTYHHKKTWNDDNGFSHIRASLIGPSEVLPFSAGRLLLGTWQQVVVLDFDAGPRTREVCLTLIS